MRLRLIPFALTALLGVTVHARACGDLAPQLSAMARVDQALRAHVQSEVVGTGGPMLRIEEQIMVVDRQNTARLKQLLSRCGWPKTTVHGKQAVHDAWLLAQHADQDRHFQRRALVLLERSVKAGEASGWQLAYLSDRLAGADHRPQRYGTQLLIKGLCEVEFLPMDEPGLVDARRKAVGMSPLADYRAQVIKYALPASCAQNPAPTGPVER